MMLMDHIELPLPGDKLTFDSKQQTVIASHYIGDEVGALLVMGNESPHYAIGRIFLTDTDGTEPGAKDVPLPRGTFLIDSIHYNIVPAAQEYQDQTGCY